jgi:hypothetical protein
MEEKSLNKSEIYTKSVENFLGIRFVEERYKPIDIPGD